MAAALANIAVGTQAGVISENQGWSQEQIDLIKDQVAKGASDRELQLFLYQAKKTGLDPLAKQIYCIKRAGKMTIQTSIDGYRLIADRTGLYAGNDDYEFDDSENKPKWARSTVYKMVAGQRCPFTATARWEQYYPGEAQAFQWKKMPHLMLGKCAEALALRKAFPADLSGVYTKEEMMTQDERDSEALRNDPKAVAAFKELKYLEEEASIQHQAQATAETYKLQAEVGTKEAAAEVGQKRIEELQKKVPFDQHTQGLLDAAKPKEANGPISKAQRDRLWAVAKESGWSTKQSVKDMLLIDFNLSSSADVLKSQYNAVIERLQGAPPPSEIPVEVKHEECVEFTGKVTSVSEPGKAQWSHVSIISSTETGSKLMLAYALSDLYVAVCGAKKAGCQVHVKGEHVPSKDGRPVNKISAIVPIGTTCSQCNLAAIRFDLGDGDPVCDTCGVPF